MTTGRINQVTIVRRGWLLPPVLRGGELVTGRGRQGAQGAFQGDPPAERRRRLAPWAPPRGIRFPPLCSPGDFRRARGPEARAGCRLGPPRGDRKPRGAAIQRSQGEGISCCSLDSWPGASRPQNPSGVDRARGHDRYRATRLSATPWRAPLQGVTAVMGRLDRGGSPTRLHNGPRDDDLFR